MNRDRQAAPRPQLVVVSRSQIALARITVSEVLDLNPIWWCPTVRAVPAMQARRTREGVTSRIAPIRKLATMPDMERCKR